MKSLKYSYDFIVFPQNLNNLGTLFGGVLLSHMDIAAATLARKALYGTDSDGAVTASMDKVNFNAPSFVNDLIRIDCEIKKFGRTSFEIRAKVHKETPRGEEVKICDANFTFVAMKDKKPFVHHLSFEQFEINER